MAPRVRDLWRFTCPDSAKANFSTIVGNNVEVDKISDAMRLGGGTFLFNLSQAVGRFGENAAQIALRARRIDHDFIVKNPVTNLDETFNLKNMTLGETIQMQNKSGHGLDMVCLLYTSPSPRDS